MKVIVVNVRLKILLSSHSGQSDQTLVGVSRVADGPFLSIGLCIGSDQFGICLSITLNSRDVLLGNGLSEIDT